ncbi:MULTISPECIES: hypothetical protein [Streptomyces]|uniref:Uncharacterized protein n=1 Tax=Streptomyces decoyicus TaxID=249567 RepID=A0ABZ1FFU3_9ACTN|nr:MULTISPECIES: hypothetical protein [Streptomyces]MCL7492660.1 hypothetical protein [Streptomyces sp. MCA2]WSB69026.1 hypothetical protein OG863_14255 [Streptomyces decoyicus]
MATSTEGRDEDSAPLSNSKGLESILKQLTEIQQAQEQQIRKSKLERVPAFFSAAVQGLKFLIDILRT